MGWLNYGVTVPGPFTWQPSKACHWFWNFCFSIFVQYESIRCIYSNPQKTWLKNIDVDKIPQKSWSILRSTCYKWRGSFSPTRKKLRISIFLRGCEGPTGWWFGTFFNFPNSWDDDPIWLSSVSGGRYTTNQQKWTDLKPGPWFFRPRKGAPRALGGASSRNRESGAAGVEIFRGDKHGFLMGLIWVNMAKYWFLDGSIMATIIATISHLSIFVIPIYNHHELWLLLNNGLRMG